MRTGPTRSDAVADRWDDLVADAEVTAEEYREAGWETLLLRPGDVTPASEEPFGLDVLLPGDEYEALEEAVADATVDTTRVFRATEGGVHFYALVYEAGDAEVAVICPAFLSVEEAPALRDRAAETGELYVHCRPLSADSRVTFVHEDPELFF